MPDLYKKPWGVDERETYSETRNEKIRKDIDWMELVNYI